MSRPTPDNPGYASDAEVKAIMEAYEREIVYPAAKILGCHQTKRPTVQTKRPTIQTKRSVLRL